MASNSARRFNPKLISLAVASCFAAGTAYGQAVLPTGANPATMVGVTNIGTAGSVMNVNTHLDRSLIQWNTFSIGQGATVNFNQPSSISAVLNRVMGGVPSEILGAMNSNGRVMLINANGITFGAGAQINVAGLVASTLNLSDSDFLANRLRFTGGMGAGSVINEANSNINAAPGGEVYLVGKSVTNSGTITTPRGEVVLAAGNSVELVTPGTPNLRVEITAPDNQAVNLGTIVADAGRVGIYAGLVRQGGTIRADSAQVTDDGRIVLKATKDVTVEAGSVTSASGVKGGTVHIQSGDRTMVLGDVSATGSADKGGTVQVLGNLVGVMGNATIDASGDTGGGTVLVGGDFQGKNPAIPNAYRTVFGPDATIKADAVTNGDGGKVIVWADDATRAYGTISARGGSQGGDGGFVEVSGKRWLDFHAKVDTRAPKGKTGTLLLDPNDVEIVDSDGNFNGGFVGGAEGDPFVWQGGGEGSMSQVAWGDFETAGTIIGNLQTSNVIVNTSGPEGSEGNGDIMFAAGATYTSNNSLTFAANRHIFVNSATIINEGHGDINMIAGSDISMGPCFVCAPGGATIETGGSIALLAGGHIGINGSTLRAGTGMNSGRDTLLSVVAGGDVTIANGSTLVATGANNPSGPGYLGRVFISGASVGIFDTEIQASGGPGRSGGQGQVDVNSFGSLNIDYPESTSTRITATGGLAFGGPEGATGTGGVASVFLNAAGALSITGSATVSAYGGDSNQGDGGGAQISLFGGSVYVGTNSFGIYAEGGQGSSGQTGGGAAINIFGGQVTIDGAEGYALGGSGGMRGGDAAITISSGSSLHVIDHATVVAEAGNGSTGGNSSVGMSALNDIRIADSHVEAEGANSSAGGSAVVLLSSTLGSVLIDHTHTFPGPAGTVMAEVLEGAAEVSLKAFDKISVDEDYVEANAWFGGSANIRLHFTGRSTGGFFVNGVEGVTTDPLPPNAEYGFFVNGEAAQPGVNFFVTYSGALPDPCLLAPEICAPPQTQPPEIGEDTQVGTAPGDKKKKAEPVCRG